MDCSILQSRICKQLFISVVLHKRIKFTSQCIHICFVDITKVVGRIHGKTFKGLIVKATLVNKPDCVLVKGIPTGAHKDTIHYFFEEIIDNEKKDQSDDGTEHVSDVKMLADTNQALVYLNDNAGEVDLVVHTPSSCKIYYSCTRTSCASFMFQF